MLAQILRGDAARFFSAPVIGGACAEIAENDYAAFADNFFADLVNRGEHAADAIRGSVVRNGAVRNCKVCPSHEAVAIHAERNIVHPGGRAAMEGSLDERLQDVPDFTPYFGGGAPERPGML